MGKKKEKEQEGKYLILDPSAMFGLTDISLQYMRGGQLLTKKEVLNELNSLDPDDFQSTDGITIIEVKELYNMDGFGIKTKIGFEFE